MKEIIDRLKAANTVFQDRVVVSLLDDSEEMALKLPYLVVVPRMEEGRSMPYTATTIDTPDYTQIRQTYLAIAFLDPKNTPGYSDPALLLHGVRGQLLGALSGFTPTDAHSGMFYTGYRIAETERNAVAVIYTFETIETIDLSCYFDAWQTEPSKLLSAKGVVSDVGVSIKTPWPREE
jgi:hypothetical protein